MDSKEKALKIAKILDNKKARDIRILEIGKVSNLGDYFVICSASSNVQAHALSDEVKEKLFEENEVDAGHIEGYAGGTWILMDYSDVLLHIFLDETRAFYDIERLWHDAPELEFEQQMD